MKSERPPSSASSPLATVRFSRPTRAIALFGTALVLVGVGIGWRVWRGNGLGQNAAIGQQQPQATPVKLETLEPATVTISSDFVGSLEAEEVVEIRPENTGRVRQFFVEEGDFVETGEPIAELEPAQEQANLSSLQAAVNSAQAIVNNAQSQIAALEADRIALAAEVELTREDYRRIEFLVKEGAFTEQQLDQAKRDREVALANLAAIDKRITAAQASLRQAQAGLEQARANADRAVADLRETLIRAPFAGVIGDIPIRVGSVVSDADTLTTLTQNNVLSLNISVPMERSPELEVGQFVELTSERGTILNTGRLSFIDPNINPDQQTILAKATFENPGTLLRNGQFVRARLIWRTETGLLVPAEAVTRLAGEPFIFVAEPPGPEDEVPPDIELVARQRPVKLGKLQGNRYQVTDGLSAGEQIVVSGVLNLTNGSPIMVMPDTPPAAESDFVAP